MARASSGILLRCPVNQPMMTSLKPIDAMVISRGQHELIISDRQTGKTAVTVDTILNQKRWNDGQAESKILHCVYVAIGQKRSTVAQLVKTLKENDVMKYTITIAPEILFYSWEPLNAVNHRKPWTPSTSSFYRDLFQHQLHQAHRQVVKPRFVNLQQPTDRSLYKGNVPYRYVSRCLQRCASHHARHPQHSSRIFVIIETQGGDMSAYIPTNVISITDRQTFLDAELFFCGVRPAVNVGLSLSCVGSAVQTYVDTPKCVWIRNDKYLINT
ncbi:P-loop containing nucleoside triphosphate hydrolase protein [Mycena vulgaris]|nr:P-loop containing nucleoside triphosphate hydrolase protein [Mycena vulgaris]